MTGLPSQTLGQRSTWLGSNDIATHPGRSPQAWRVHRLRDVARTAISGKVRAYYHARDLLLVARSIGGRMPIMCATTPSAINAIMLSALGRAEVWVAIVLVDAPNSLGLRNCDRW